MAAGLSLCKKLGETDLFSRLPTAALEEAFASARVRHLEKDATVFVQGTPAKRAHILLDGRIRILQTDADGEQVVMRFIGPGETFGTVGLFTNRRYPAHAVTVTACTEISWSEASLLELIAQHSQIALNLVRIIGARLRETQERLRELATQRVERRIANVLLRLAAQAGEINDKGNAIDFPLSRKDVAEMCGATLHTVSRTLTGWERMGAVNTHRQHVTIRDINAIRKIADDGTPSSQTTLELSPR